MKNIDSIEYINLFINSLCNDFDDNALSQLLSIEELNERRGIKK